MGTTSDEGLELAERARELNEAIAAAKKRIRKLQGLPETEGQSGTSRWQRWAEVEVEVELPPIDPKHAPAALMDVIHRETGLVGALETNASKVAWRVFDPRVARRKLEVTLSGFETPTLRLRDTAAGAHRSMFSVAITLALILPAILATTAMHLNTPLTMALIFVVSLGASFAQVALSRRAGRRALKELGSSIGEALPMETHDVRVVTEGEEEETEHELELVGEEMTRGVS